MIPIGVDDEIRLRLIFGMQLVGCLKEALVDETAFAEWIDVLVSEADVRIFPVDEFEIVYDAIK